MRVIVILTALLVTAGCATSRSVIPLDAVEMENPEKGQAVSIIEVVDARIFLIDPGSPDMPSLAGEEINDPAFTSRAIGRKRNTYGMALGDVRLTEDQTVTEIVRLAIANGFRQAGYRVVDEPGAIPVKARIKQFWSWFHPGFWAIRMRFRAETELKSPLFAEPLTVKTEITQERTAAFESDWQAINNQGLHDLALDVARHLPRPMLADEESPEPTPAGFETGS